MAQYTEDELIAKIRAIDTEIERLLLSTAVGGPGGRTPLKYRIGSKEVDITSRVELLQKQRRLYEDMRSEIISSPVVVTTIPDYNMSRYGEQLGEYQDGDDE
jgi:hypothetical protein